MERDISARAISRGSYSEAELTAHSNRPCIIVITIVRHFCPMQVYMYISGHNCTATAIVIVLGQI